MSSCNELGILRSLKMWSSDNHLKLCILKCETFVLIPTLNEMLIQQRVWKLPHSLQSNLVRTSNPENLWSYHMRYLFSKAKITRFEETSFELTGETFLKMKIQHLVIQIPVKTKIPTWLFLGLAFDSTPVFFIYVFIFCMLLKPSLK